MSKRTAITQITMEAKILKHLRLERGLSIRQAARLTKMSPTLINFIENGRTDIIERHISKLLAIYGTTRATFDLYLEGKALIPRDIKKECIEMICGFNSIQMQSAEPLLRAISGIGK